MFSELPDGSAIVYGLSVRPFVPLQHMQIDVTTINRLANYSLSFARERGYLQTRDALHHATHFSESNESRPLVEQEGYAHQNQDRTVFYAGVDVQLSNLQPHFHRPAIPSTLMLFTKLYISHVGRSSYNVKGTLYTYVDEDEVEYSSFSEKNYDEHQNKRREENAEALTSESIYETEEHRHYQYKNSHNSNNYKQQEQVLNCNNIDEFNLQRMKTIHLPAQKTELGHFLFTCVRVSSVSHLPIALSNNEREVLLQHCQMNKCEEERSMPQNVISTEIMSRINVYNHLEQSGILDMSAYPEIKLVLESCDAANSHFTNDELSLLNKNNVKMDEQHNILKEIRVDIKQEINRSSRYNRCFLLRESDMDFNKHVNQLATMHLVINTFRSALHSKSSIYSSLLAEDINYLIGDLLLRRLRIDYVREIPYTDVAMEVYLFPMSQAEQVKFERTNEHARLNEIAELGFFTVGVNEITTSNTLQTTTEQHNYISTVGTLNVPV